MTSIIDVLLLLSHNFLGCAIRYNRRKTNICTREFGWSHVTVVKWLDCWTCNHKVVGSNPTKLTADFTMTRVIIDV